MILLIEDNADIREAMTYFFEMEGTPMAGVADGHSAIAWARENVPSVILLDAMLPDMTAPDVARELRSLCHAPILVITADGRVAEKAAAIGAEGFLQKPFDLADLSAAIRRLTRNDQ